jgi:hypothetical protein
VRGIESHTVNSNGSSNTTTTLADLVIVAAGVGAAVKALRGFSQFDPCHRMVFRL